MTPKFSVLIPSTGSVKDLERILNSILKQNIDKTDFEIIIVLNGISQDKVNLISKKLTLIDLNINVSSIEIKGVNRARNQAIKISRGEVLFFFDDDCELTNKNLLKQHLNLHSMKPQVFAFGGGYSLAPTAHFFDVVYNYLQMKWLTNGLLNETDEQLFSQYLLGGNFSIKKELLQNRNLKFNENIVYGGSEHEFFLQATSLGLPLEIINLEVAHHTEESIYKTSKKIFKQGKGKAIIEIKYPNQKNANSGSVTSPKRNIFENIVFIYLNYVFWTGYYSQKNEPYKILWHLIKDIFDKLNFYRFEILKKINNNH